MITATRFADVFTHLSFVMTTMPAPLIIATLTKVVALYLLIVMIKMLALTTNATPRMDANIPT
jgi:hypothetical protein